MAGPRASSWRRSCGVSAARWCIVEGADRVLPREPAPLGQALGEALRRDGIELVLGKHATAARREGEEYVLELEGGAGAAG